MERIKNILGLRVYNNHILDRFQVALIKSLERIAGKVFGPGGICVEKETDSVERRAGMLGNEKEKAYQKALRLLAELDPKYEKYPPKTRRAPLYTPEPLKRKIRLAVCVGTGNKIPVKELDPVLVKNLLKEKGYSYQRKKGEMGWYCDGRFIAKTFSTPWNIWNGTKSLTENYWQSTSRFGRFL